MSIFRRQQEPDPAVTRLEERIKQLEGAVEALHQANILPYDDSAIREALTGLEDRVDYLRDAIAEGIERVDRSERRIHAVVHRARKELAESGLENPGLEAEAHQLQLLDGRGGGGEGVQPMPAPVAPRERLDVSFLPGQWTEEDIQGLMGGDA